MLYDLFGNYFALPRGLKKLWQSVSIEEIATIVLLRCRLAANHSQ